MNSADYPRNHHGNLDIYMTITINREAQWSDYYDEWDEPQDILLVFNKGLEWDDGMVMRSSRSSRPGFDTHLTAMNTFYTVNPKLITLSISDFQP